MRKWRVGTISMGILLIATGLLLFIGELQGFNGAALIMRWWPVILIVLGLEILAYILLSHEEQPRIKFDGLSIFLTILVILISSGVYGVSSFLRSDLSKGVFAEIGYFKNESIFNKSYDINAAKVKKLQIDNNRGRVQVSQYDGDTIKIDTAIIIRNNDEEKAVKLAEDLVELTEGETVTLNTRNAGVLEDSRNYQVTINYEVKVPKELVFDINNKYGEINLRDLYGDTKVQGEYGQIIVENIRGDVEIENSFGETRVEDVIGKLAIDNEHGEVYYSSRQTAEKDITLNSRMGGITIELPRDQQGVFDAYTKLGNITFENFQTQLSVQEDNTNQKLQGTIGRASPVIKVNADHGEIIFQGR